MNSAGIDRTLYEGMDYSVSKDVDWDVHDMTDETAALAIAPPDFEPMEITPANSKVFDSKSNSVEFNQAGQYINPSRHGTSSTSGNCGDHGTISAKKYGSLGRIITNIINCTSSNASSLNAAGVSAPGDGSQGMTPTSGDSQNSHDRHTSNDDQLKDICRKFLRYMNVGDMNGLGRFIGQRCSERCVLTSPDLPEPVWGRTELMMLFSLLFEAYPDGVWSITSLTCHLHPTYGVRGEPGHSCGTNSSFGGVAGWGGVGAEVVCLYRFTGTGVINYPLHEVFRLIRKQHQQNNSSNSNSRSIGVCNSSKEGPADASVQAAPNGPFTLPAPSHRDEGGAYDGYYVNVDSSGQSQSQDQQATQMLNTVAEYCHPPHPAQQQQDAGSLGTIAPAGIQVQPQPQAHAQPLSSLPPAVLVPPGVPNLYVPPAPDVADVLPRCLPDLYVPPAPAVGVGDGSPCGSSCAPRLPSPHSAPFLGIAGAGINSGFSSHNSSFSMGNGNSGGLGRQQGQEQEPHVLYSDFCLQGQFGYSTATMTGVGSSAAVAAGVRGGAHDDDDDNVIRAPRRSADLRQMGLIENNVLKNGPVTQRRKLVFSFEPSSGLICSIVMGEQ